MSTRPRSTARISIMSAGLTVKHYASNSTSGRPIWNWVVSEGRQKINEFALRNHSDCRDRERSAHRDVRVDAAILRRHETRCFRKGPEREALGGPASRWSNAKNLRLLDADGLGAYGGRP